MRKLITLVAVMLGLFSSALAQSTTGSVSGQVFDPQQAVVANASVTLKNKANGTERTTNSNSDGSFAFPSLPPGIYTVTVTANGFEKSSSDVQVSIAQDASANVNLSLKGTSVSVDIVGESGNAVVQTDSPQLSTVITNQQLQNLPTADRNPYSFISLTPGASSSNDGRGVGAAINGSRSSGGNYILDGGENNDTFVTGVAQSVPLDAVQEYTIQTNNFAAEYGRNAGFIANVATKGGGNDFHGTGYIYNRNSRLASNSFDNNANGLQRGIYNRNQYGFSVGGPVVKNKLFFFAAVEPTHVRSIAPNTFDILTPQVVAISSPGSQAIFQKFPLPTAGIINRNVETRLVCPFSRIAVGCDTTGAVNIPIFQRVVVNGPTDAGGGSPQNSISSSFRVDYNASEKNQFAARYAYQNVDQSGQFAPTGSYIAALNQPTLQRNQNMLVSLTHSFASNFISESRVIYNRINGPINPLTPNPAFPGFFLDAEDANLPVGSSSFGGAQNVYQFFQTASWIKGKHNIKFGGQYVHLRDNRSFGAYETAQAEFDDIQTFINGALIFYTIAVNPKGQLPGTALSAPFGPPSFSRHFHYNEPGFFVQDTWKLSSRLTITPGLRYEYFGILHSPKNERQLDANFYPGSGSTLIEQLANGKFGRTADQTGSLKDRFYRPDYKDFAPRFGVAYDLTGDGKTVVRGGIGYFYDRNFGNVVFNAIQNPPNYATTLLTDVTLTPAVVANQYAVFPTTGSVTLNPSSARYLDVNLRTAYTISYNATVEHDLLNKLVVAASYVGSRGKRLYSLNNINRRGSCVLNNSCAGSTTARLNRSATSINTRGNDNSSEYNALQVRADSRYIDKVGLQFGFNYTLSKSTDNGSSFFGDDAANGFLGFGATDTFNFNTADKGLSDFDAKHRYVGNFTYELPFFKNTHGLAKSLLHGFSITGILQGQTGQPYTIFARSTTNRTVENVRAIARGTIQAPSFSVGAAANRFILQPITRCAAATASNCLANGTTVNAVEAGTLARGIYRRPGTRFADFAVLKDFALPKFAGREGLKFQIRADLFNAFNHSNLYLRTGSNEINTTTNGVRGVIATKRDNRTISFTGKLIF